MEHVNVAATQTTNANNEKERHIEEANNGATMTFYGYGTSGYKDFKFLPNSQATKKTFEFEIHEAQAQDAFDGVGFFFNSEITGTYGAGQVLNGYLLFLDYDGAYGRDIYLYKVTNLDTEAFHNARTSDIPAGGAFTLIATEKNKVYNLGSFMGHRKIQIQAEPNALKMWYKGGTDVTAADGDLDEADHLLTWTLASDGSTATSVPLERIGSHNTAYGFGPVASYRGHGCAALTIFSLTNLSMKMDVVRSLTEVVRQPNWHENTDKFLVNLNEDPIEDFSSTSITAELLNRLRNDDIYYVGWCSDENAEASTAFLEKHDLKGAIVNIDADATNDYNEQINAIADAVYARYVTHNADTTTILVTDNVQLNATGASMTNTADPAWPDGKWKISFTAGFASPAPAPVETVMSDLECDFDEAGTYRIYYQNTLVNTIIAHRAPVAAFTVTNADTTPQFVSASFDPDLDAITEAWTYIDLSDGSMASPLPIPIDPALTFTEGHIYLITLTVTDARGAVTSLSRQVSRGTPSGEGGGAVKPVAMFTLSPSTVIHGVTVPETVSITDQSFDIAGSPISVKYYLDGTSNEIVLTDGAYDVSALAAGSHTITQIVTRNSDGVASEAFVRTFTVVADSVDPTVTANPASGSTFTENTNVVLSFGDTGGSGFNKQRVAVTDSSAAPASGAWSTWKTALNRSVLIQNSGISYVHYEALDKAGNSASGYFEYTLNKAAPTLVLANTGTGKEVTLTATLTHADDETTPITGTVFFKQNTAIIGQATITNGVAQTVWSPSSKGDKTITALYTGDSYYASAQSDCTFTVSWSNNDRPITVNVNPIGTGSGAPPIVGLPDTREVIGAVRNTGYMVPSGSSITLEVEPLNENDVPQDDYIRLQDALTGQELGTYLDLSLYLVAPNGRTQIHELDEDISVTILIPEELRADGRIFSIVMVHNGVTYRLYDLDSDPNTITFPTRLFSTYMLVYTDINMVMNPPKTGDAVALAGFILLPAGIAFAWLSARKRKV